MGKGGAVLGIIGILLGAGGLVFGFIAWSSLNTIQTQGGSGENIDTWYVTDYSTFLVSPAATVIELSNLTIAFELTSTASVYMSFTCQAEIFPAGGTYSVFFFFKVDGVRLDNPVAQVGSTNGASSTDYFSVSLQHSIENMLAGSHNVTVEVSSGTAVNELSEMTLFVQSST
jgi:hypothetical protein